jgi:phosphoribosylamine--glycine ligase
VTELHAAPGNPGIEQLAQCHPVAADDVDAVLGLARELRSDLVVIGPEGPLVAGVADALRHAGIGVFGPSAAAARIEGSKTFAKDVMGAAGVPTARVLDAPRAPCVVKADGLAEGKGVVVCRTEPDVERALDELAALNQPLVVEELLEGPEVSLFAVCDGVSSVVLPIAQDYKRAYDGDTGPNTGGMGSYAPVPGLDANAVATLAATVVDPVLAELRRRGSPFVGTLFAGLMLTEDGPRVLEYNCRFGDPETQSVLPLLEGDLAELLHSAARGAVAQDAVEVVERAAVTVVLAAGEYPSRGDRGSLIEGIDEAEASGALVFHAGTASVDGRIVTSGGRVLAITGVGESLAAARDAAFRAADMIHWPGARRRDDIARAAAEGARVEFHGAR